MRWRFFLSAGPWHRTAAHFIRFSSSGAARYFFGALFLILPPLYSLVEEVCTLFPQCRRPCPVCRRGCTLSPSRSRIYRRDTRSFGNHQRVRLVCGVPDPGILSLGVRSSGPGLQACRGPRLAGIAQVLSDVLPSALPFWTHEEALCRFCRPGQPCLRCGRSPRQPYSPPACPGRPGRRRRAPTGVYRAPLDMVWPSEGRRSGVRCRR